MGPIQGRHLYEIHQGMGFDGVADWEDTFVGAPIF